MSLLREKTREIIREGEAKRKIRPAEGRPYQIYKWWLLKTEKYVYRENFCHYWRVVLIWAPLLAVRLFFKRVFRNRIFWITALILAGVTLAVLGFVVPAVGSILLLLLGSAAAGLGLVMGLMVASDIQEGDVGLMEASWQEKTLFFSVAIILLPASLLGFVSYWIVYAVGNEHARRLYRWFWDARLIGGHISPLLLLLMIGYGFMTYLGIRDNWWGVSLTIAILVVGVFACYWTVDMAGPVIAERRDRVRKEESYDASRESLRELDPALRLIFATYHPDATDEEAYQNWRTRYVAYAESLYSSDVWISIRRGQSGYWPHHWSWPEGLMWDVDEVTYRALRAGQSVANSRQGVAYGATAGIKRALASCGDFVVLLAQMIRVKKWGICPIMELPDEI